MKIVKHNKLLKLNMKQYNFNIFTNLTAGEACISALFISVKTTIKPYIVGLKLENSKSVIVSLVKTVLKPCYESLNNASSNDVASKVISHCFYSKNFTFKATKAFKKL